MRARELREFYQALLADNDGVMLADGREALQVGLHKDVGIDAAASQRLIRAAMARGEHVRSMRESQTEDLSSGRKAGWLMKQGGFVKNWKQRWFVLDWPVLKYYAGPESTEPKGTVDCNQVTLSEKYAYTKTNKDHCFALYHPERRVYYLQAEDAKSMMRWVAAIRHEQKVLPQAQTRGGWGASKHLPPTAEPYRFIFMHQESVPPPPSRPHLLSCAAAGRADRLRRDQATREGQLRQGPRDGLHTPCPRNQTPSPANPCHLISIEFHNATGPAR
jgi:hypothetical protein